MADSMWKSGPALRVDADGVVASVDDRWNEFVGRHRIAGLRPVAAGTPFFEAVENGDTYALFGVMLERARNRYRVGVDVRAVTPEYASRVELALALCDPSGTVELTLRVLREQRRWTIGLFDASAPRGHEEVEVCDFCQRVVGFDWVEPDVALRQLRVPAAGPYPRLHASVCDPCERTIYATCQASRLRVG
jgi:hypothetical protein